MPLVRYGREVPEEFVTADQLYKKAIVYNADDIGKVRLFGSESLRHFLSKSMLLYHLKRMGHRAVCEAEISGVGVIDVFDIDTNVMYEIESEPYIKKAEKRKMKYHQAGVDLVIIQIRNWNEDMGWLSEYIKAWIRPD